MKTKTLIIAAAGAVWFGTIYLMILSSAGMLLTTVA